MSPGPVARQLVDGVEQRSLQVVVAFVLVLAHRRAVDHLDGIGAARDADHGRGLPPKWRLKRSASIVADVTITLRSGRRGSSVRRYPSRKSMLRLRSLRLVDDDRVIGVERTIALRLGEQDAVGHQLDDVRGAGVIAEANLEAHQVAQAAAQLRGDALRHAAGRDPPRLRVADEAADAPAEFKADFGSCVVLPSRLSPQTTTT
jgi:hypothetical protein